MLSLAYRSLCGQMGWRPTLAGRRSLCCPERESGGGETLSLLHPAPCLLPCACPRTGGTRARQREVCASGCVLGPGCSSWSDGSPRPRCGPRHHSGNCESWTVREWVGTQPHRTGEGKCCLAADIRYPPRGPKPCAPFFTPQRRCTVGM